MYVNVEEAELKSGTGFFAAGAGFLPYGAKVTILQESGKWIEVESQDNSKISGWLPASSLTKKRFLLMTVSIVFPLLQMSLLWQERVFLLK